MTGYGRAEARAGGGLFTIEVRSLNNRYLDIQIKTPKSLIPLEQRFRKVVQERFSRGRFEIFLSRNGAGEKAGRLSLDMERAEQYVGLLRELKERLGLPGEIGLSLVASAPDVITDIETREEPEALWQTLSEALNSALAELERMRTDEGAALARDISDRLGSIESSLQRIKVLAPRTVEASKQRIEEAVKRLTGEPPEQARLTQEIAFIAERSDITEELTRLQSHIDRFREMLSKGGNGEAVGRKLDFLLQEMMREVNTAASKAADAHISHSAVNMKAELEKIREQVQNIE